MNHLDLGPNDYRKKDPGTGQWHLPDDPKLMRALFFVCACVLALIYFANVWPLGFGQFGVTTLFAFCAGGAFALWLKDVY